jgi:mono/diheme cytochrome c family protein
MIKNILLFTMIALVVIACGNADPGTGIAAMAAVEEQPSEGAKIYKQYCLTCHGLYGDMGASGAANLQESKLTLEQRVEVITNGRNTMTGFKTLMSEDKIKLAAQYTFELKNN